MFQEILSNLNWLHILVATIAYFALGAIWYGPLFSKPWIKGHGINVNDPEMKKGVAAIMIGSFVFFFIITTALAIVYSIVTVQDAMHAVKWGAFFGFGFAIPIISINSLYLKKPMSVHLIDGLYHVVGMIAASLILALWK
jgi:hypothetical protein